MRGLLTIIVTASTLLQGQGDAGGRQRGQRGRGSGGVHIVYAWQERVDQIPVQHEIHLYGNGFIRYAQRAGTGPLQETTLPSDVVFVATVVKRFRVARKTKQLVPPCGAPQGGRLTVRLGRRPLKVDLSQPERWNRYGQLVRRIVARVVGTLPPPLEADCQPLRLRVDPNALTKRRRPVVLPDLKQERQLLLRFGAATTPDARLALLASLARIREGDRFFRWALLRGHPGSLPARRLIRRHSAELVRGVRSGAEARELLGYLGQLTGPEGQYHRAVLQLMVGRTEAAARNLQAFHTSLNQLGRAKRTVERVTRLRASQLDVRRIRPPWGRIRRAPSRLFRFWLRLARTVWAGDPEQAPPLALALYRRALHYARVSALGASVRAYSGGAQSVRSARRLVKSLFGRLSGGRWDELPFLHRQDLLAVTGFVRRYPTVFEKGWIAKNVDSYADSVCRMIRMRYFDVADRFVERMVEQKKLAQGPLRLAQGRCLVEMERWAPARAALSRAATLGQGAARVALAGALLDQGDLVGAERVLEGLPSKSADAFVIESRLWRLRERPDKALRAAQNAVRLRGDARSRLAVGRSWELAGERARARLAFRAALSDTSVAGGRARLALARLELLAGDSRAALDAVWPVSRSHEQPQRAAAHAVIAMAAAQLKMARLAALQTRRALYHAGQNPLALTEVADVLISQGRRAGDALRALQLARGKRPRWSRVFALLAFVYGQLRQLPRALQAITAALDIRPEYPPYRGIERALVRLAPKR